MPLAKQPAKITCSGQDIWFSPPARRSQKEAKEPQKLKLSLCALLLGICFTCLSTIGLHFLREALGMRSFMDIGGF